MNTQKLLEQLGPRIALYRDPATGIAYVKEGMDTEHACHPWFNKKPSKSEMDRRGWTPKDRLITSHGRIYNTTIFNTPRELDKIAGQNCQCGGRHEQTAREKQLMPGGMPRYVHCYDNGGESFDRYTIVFTGRYRHKTGGEFWYLGASEHPFHPQGLGQLGTSPKQIDDPIYSHLGKKVTFQSLPEDVQMFILQEYKYLWDLPGARKD